MKKIFALVFALCLILCSCGEQGVSVESEKYQGRTSYENISLGATGDMAQDDEYYYYADEYGFFSVNKKTGERKTFCTDFMIPMFTFNDEIYFVENGAVLVFDKKSQSIVKKSYTELFSLELEVPQTRYGLSVLMVKDGWLVYINDKETGLCEVYLTDRDFTTKTLLPIYKFDFVLDDDVFYSMGKDNIFCYNLKTQKTSYIISKNDVIVSDDANNRYNMDYFGNGKIIVYDEDKSKIINLVDGSVSLELPYSNDGISNILFDDKKTYITVKESQEKHRIDTISNFDNKIETIYNFEVNLPHYYIVIENIDKQYLYLNKIGHYNDDGTPTGEHIRINKDGSGEKLLFKQIAS